MQLENTTTTTTTMDADDLEVKARENTPNPNLKINFACAANDLYNRHVNARLEILRQTKKNVDRNKKRNRQHWQ